MINLLPVERKRELRAARINVVLRRYVIFEVVGIALLAAITTGTYLIMNMTKVNAEAEIASNTARAGDYQQVEADARQFRSNLETAKTILNKEVRYTKVILAISQSIPDGIILDVLSLDAQTFGTPTSLTAKGKDYQDALRLKSSLEKSNIFSNVYLESVSKSTDTESDYPVDIRINVTINKEVINS